MAANAASKSPCPNFDDLHLHPEGRGVRPHLFDERSSGFVAWIDEHGDATQPGGRLLEELQQLENVFVGHVARAGTLPPGFPKPATIPSSTGLPTPTITMGIDFVACMRARVAGMVGTRIKSGPWATSSPATDGRRLFLPSAVRGSSNTMFRPSVHPSFSSSGRSRPRKTSMSARGNAERKPMRRGAWPWAAARGQPEQGASGDGDECPPIHH